MEKKLTTETFIKKAVSVHGTKYDYSKTEYVNSRTKIQIICPKHGMFEQRPSSHLQGNGCKQCAKEWSSEHKENHTKSARRSRGFTNEEWIAKAKQVHGDKYDYSLTEYVNQRTNVKIICPEHGVFEQKADSHLRGFGCQKCGNCSENHKGVHDWTEEQYQKIARTCLQRYGAKRYLDSDNGREKMKTIQTNPIFRKKMKEIISSDAVQNLTKQTCLKKYGVKSPMQLQIVQDKASEAKRTNGTWSTSKPEEMMYLLLLGIFDKSDVIRQYKDVRYPFHCDFYIKSLDLFIELNATWLHGGHWFDMTDSSDATKLSIWQSKAYANHRFYQVAIDVWTVRDVKKRDIALTNNLNYLVFWDNDLSDFLKWLHSDHHVLNNIT